MKNIEKMKQIKNENECIELKRKQIKNEIDKK